MKEIEVAKSLIKRIIILDVSFKSAIKQLNNEGYPKDFINSISGLVGCELRHHLLFTQLLKQKGVTSLDEDALEICLALANRFFYKRFNCLEVQNSVKENRYFIDNKDYFETDKSPMDLIELPRESIDFISIRFNTPKWLIHMWQKHYGISYTFKVLKSLSKIRNSYLRVNTLLTSKDELLSNHKGEILDTDISELVSVQNKVINQSFDYRSDKLFSIKKSILNIVKKQDMILLPEICVYSDEDNSIIKELITESDLSKGLSVIVPELESRADVMRFVRTLKAKNVNIFEGKEKSGFDSGLSSKQDLFFVFAKSSSFDKIDASPDFIARFSKTKIDEVLAHQKRLLELCSTYIADEGQLIYIVDTLNKKETTGMIKAFLESHNDFVLEDEKQYICFDENEAITYYASLRKKTIND